MPYDPEKHHRRSLRLKGYDYSQAGAYFVTIVTQNRACLFGEVVDGEMRLNEYGKIVAQIWRDLPNHVPNLQLEDAFVVMPNHVHGILIINHPVVGAIHESPLLLHKLPRQELPPQESPLQMTGTQQRNMALPKLIGRFKMLSAKRINILRDTPALPCGNAIITNTSSAMNNPSSASANTFPPTPCAGTWIAKIPAVSPSMMNSRFDRFYC